MRPREVPAALQTEPETTYQRAVPAVPQAEPAPRRARRCRRREPAPALREEVPAVPQAEPAPALREEVPAVPQAEPAPALREEVPAVPQAEPAPRCARRCRGAAGGEAGTPTSGISSAGRTMRGGALPLDVTTRRSVGAGGADGGGLSAAAGAIGHGHLEGVRA